MALTRACVCGAGGRQRLLYAFRYDEVVWDHTRTSVVLEYGDEARPNFLTVITPQATLIASLITRAIKNLDLMDRRYRAPPARPPAHCTRT
jgi:hypothetical protein